MKNANLAANVDTSIARKSFLSPRPGILQDDGVAWPSGYLLTPEIRSGMFFYDYPVFVSGREKSRRSQFELIRLMESADFVTVPRSNPGKFVLFFNILSSS